MAASGFSMVAEASYPRATKISKAFVSHETVPPRIARLRL
jgi:hypothetical protein